MNWSQIVIEAWSEPLVFDEEELSAYDAGLMDGERDFGDYVRNLPPIQEARISPNTLFSAITVLTISAIEDRCVPFLDPRLTPLGCIVVARSGRELRRNRGALRFVGPDAVVLAGPGVGGVGSVFFGGYERVDDA